MTEYVHVITEFAHGEPVRRHVVATTGRKVSASSWNQEVRSVNAFRTYCYRFFQIGKAPPAVGFGVQFKEDFDFENKVIPHDELPMFEYATIFDFYAAIGFDYRRKRFIKMDQVDKAAMALARFDGTHNGNPLGKNTTLADLVGGELYRMKARAVIAALDDA